MFRDKISRVEVHFPVESQMFFDSEARQSEFQNLRLTRAEITREALGYLRDFYSTPDEIRGRQSAFRAEILESVEEGKQGGGMSISDYIKDLKARVAKLPDPPPVLENEMIFSREEQDLLAKLRQSGCYSSDAEVIVEAVERYRHAEERYRQEDFGPAIERLIPRFEALKLAVLRSIPDSDSDRMKAALSALDPLHTELYRAKDRCFADLYFADAPRLNWPAEGHEICKQRALDLGRQVAEVEELFEHK